MTDQFVAIGNQLTRISVKINFSVFSEYFFNFSHCAPVVFEWVQLENQCSVTRDALASSEECHPLLRTTGFTDWRGADKGIWKLANWAAHQGGDVVISRNTGNPDFVKSNSRSFQTLRISFRCDEVKVEAFVGTDRTANGQRQVSK